MWCGVRFPAKIYGKHDWRTVSVVHRHSFLSGHMYCLCISGNFKFFGCFIIKPGTLYRVPYKYTIVLVSHALDVDHSLTLHQSELHPMTTRGMQDPYNSVLG